jgi:hypothetical protein
LEPPRSPPRPVTHDIEHDDSEDETMSETPGTEIEPVRKAKPPVKHRPLTGTMLKAAEMVALGAQSHRAIAAECKISHRLLKRWKEEREDFRLEVDRIQRQARQETQRVLQSAGKGAAAALISVVQNPDQPGAANRIKAALAILDRIGLSPDLALELPTAADVARAMAAAGAPQVRIEIDASPVSLDEIYREMVDIELDAARRNGTLHIEEESANSTVGRPPVIAGEVVQEDSDAAPDAADDDEVVEGELVHAEAQYDTIGEQRFGKAAWTQRRVR